MNINLLQIVAYLFKCYPIEKLDSELKEKKLITRLKQAGFQVEIIYSALIWLTELFELKRDEQNWLLPKLTSFRLFNVVESRRIDEECRGYLLYLEQIGILNVLIREQVIDRLLHLNVDLITVSDVKLVTLIVLSVHADQKAALSMMEKLILEKDIENGVH